MKYKMLFLSFFITTNLFAGLINDVQKNQIKEHDPDAKNPLELLENHEDISTNDSTKLKTILNNENFSNEDSPIKLPGDDDFVTEKIDISLKNEFDEKISDFSKTPGSTIYIYVFFIYLLLNFLVYNYVSSLRWFAIAPPYEFGLKIERTDAQELTKKQKFKRLNIALFWFSLFYLLGTYFLCHIISKNDFHDPNSSSNWYQISLIFAFLNHLIYLFFKHPKKCPKCKSEDSMKEIYSHETPGAVFTKAEKRKVDTGRKNGSVTAYDEVYVNVSYQKIQRDFTEKCTVCMEVFNYTETFDRKL